jgi:cytochrome c oxidase assembly factor CtaG
VSDGFARGRAAAGNGAAISSATRTQPLLLGIILFLASEMMFFAGLFAAYYRTDGALSVAFIDGWTFDPLPSTLLAAAAALYLAGVRRRGRRFPHRAAQPWRTGSFLFGVLSLAVALESPLDAYSDRSFSAHMLQHLVLTMVAAPALVLGEPLDLLLATAPRVWAKAVSAVLRSKPAGALQHPLFAWSAFAAVLWGAHYSPLYELALQNERVHQAEHALFLGAALAYWQVALGSVRLPWALRPFAAPLRVIYLLSFVPSSAFLGLSLSSSGHVLYAHYLRVAGATAAWALRDQRTGGELMWLAGSLVMLAAMLSVMAQWAAQSEREADKADALGYAASEVR